MKSIEIESAFSRKRGEKKKQQEKAKVDDHKAELNLISAPSVMGRGRALETSSRITKNKCDSRRE